MPYGGLKVTDLSLELEQNPAQAGFCSSLEGSHSRYRPGAISLFPVTAGEKLK